MSQVAPLQLSYHLERRLENLRNGKREVKLKKKPQLEWHLKNMKPKSHECLVRNEFAVKPATYSATIVTDIPLYETPGVCPLPLFFPCSSDIKLFEDHGVNIG